ncbi:MAG: polysaccharide deacetylase family protein [Patescibacteria group bacterium]|nr:polysaccharide deacetylase family protein [Patescibacteria group bacterium]
MEISKITSPQVFLTFDDGPSAPFTNEILDILAGFQVLASFFVCGKNVERHPEIAKRIAAGGHTLGNHSYSHSRFLSLTGCLSSEIEKTQSIIQEVTGVRVKFFRPPWGYVRPWLASYLKKQGYQLALWDIKVYDWQKPAAAIIAKRVLQKVKPNAVILLHDGDRTRLSCDRSQTVLALPMIIQNLKEKGYTFGKIV